MNINTQPTLDLEMLQQMRATKAQEVDVLIRELDEIDRTIDAIELEEVEALREWFQRR